MTKCIVVNTAGRRMSRQYLPNKNISQPFKYLRPPLHYVEHKHGRFHIAVILSLGLLNTLSPSQTGRLVHSSTNSSSVERIQSGINYCAKTIRRSNIHHCLLPGKHLYRKVNRCKVK